ncbi:MAG: O-antigen ligase family protein [Flavobacteriaceae bacterium]|nr:O-antigen ligase family protein [Flavobacteriaceae bacterium]
MQKISLYKISLLIVVLSTFGHVLGIKIGSDAFDKLFKLIMSASVVVVLMLSLFKLKGEKINYTFLNLYIILIYGTFIISVLANSPIEYIPSILRFTMYLLACLVTYRYIEVNGLDYLIRILKSVIKFAVIITIIIGFSEVLFWDIRFMNGAYRLSGQFLGHPLAYAMFLIVLIVFTYELKIFDKNKIVRWVMLSMLIYLFMNTHSRAPIFGLCISYAIYVFIKDKNILKQFRNILIILIALSSVILVVINTDISPRIKKVFISKNSLKDNSTNTRFEIIDNTFEGMDIVDKTIGVGLGGFNRFYELHTHQLGVAAHNNYLLFFAEGGFVGLFIFILYQITLFYFLYVFVRKKERIYKGINLNRLIFVVVFFFEFLAFLLNNYYFYNSQIFVFVIIGLMLYLNKNQNKYAF